VYIHTGVPARLDKHYGRKATFVHDLMHKANLVDTAMRNPKAKHVECFKWLDQLTQVTLIKWLGRWNM
jgi:hypothetical protein